MTMIPKKYDVEVNTKYFWRVIYAKTIKKNDMKKTIFLGALILMAMACPQMADAQQFTSVSPSGHTLWYALRDGTAAVVGNYNDYIVTLTGDLVILIFALWRLRYRKVLMSLTCSYVCPMTSPYMFLVAAARLTTPHGTTSPTI